MFPPQAAENNTGFAGTIIDMSAYTEATIRVLIGTCDTGLVAMKLQSSPDMSTWTDIPNTNFSTPPATLPTSANENTVWAWYVKAATSQRYIRFAMVADTGVTGVYIVALADLTPITPQMTDPGVYASLTAT